MPFHNNLMPSVLCTPAFSVDHCLTPPKHGVQEAASERLGCVSPLLQQLVVLLPGTAGFSVPQITCDAYSNMFN